MINKIFNFFGFRTDWCKILNGEIYTNRYKEGKYPIPMSTLKSLRLVNLREHGQQQHYLLFKYDEDILENVKTDICLSDRCKNFFIVAQEFCEILKIPRKYFENFSKKTNSVTNVYLNEGNIIKIESN